MTLSLGARTGVLDGIEAYLGTGGGTANFTLYQSNTSLAVFPLTQISAAVGDALLLTAGAVNSTGTEVAGTANRFIISNQSGAAAITGTVGAIGSGADIEIPSLTVTAAATQTLNALVLRVAEDGAISTEASVFLQ